MAKHNNKAAEVAHEEEVTEKAPAEATTTPKAATEPKVSKSIVPSRYVGKYKDGGSDVLAVFIKDQCTGKEGFEFPAFFTLCRKNGIPEEQVTRYENDIAEKKHGAEGRARMTLRNMLAPIGRKNGKLVGIDGTEYPIDIPKPAASGAAKAQAEKTAEAAKGSEAA